MVGGNGENFGHGDFFDWLPVYMKRLFPENKYVRDLTASPFNANVSFDILELKMDV